MQAVQVRSLKHRYEQADERPILNQLNLALDEGEILALVGASGSGKSTLLNIIGGLESVQHGEVHVFDQALHQATDDTRTRLRRNTIGFVYQAFNLIPTLSVFDNVRLPLALAGVPRQQQQQRLDSLLDTVGLLSRRFAYPDALSGGEQQRVAIARAVVHRPPILLADEPTGNLDAATGEQVMQLLLSLVAEHKTSLLLVTHSNRVANRADRVLIMQDGKLTDASERDAGITW